ncbi:MAG: hypothetical protein AAF483_17825 [Planctomycetota bacterium]
MSFRVALAALLLAVLPQALRAQLRAQSTTDSPDLSNQTQIAGFEFEFPNGFNLSSAITPDLVHWPVVVDWDRQGRLVVVESVGVSKPIVEHNKKLLHQIVRLEDSDGDGVFDRRILAADKLPLTQGVLCIENYILASAPPNIWKLIDEDEDGYCERREIWFDGQTITHCANDLHGPYLGLDGWIYWCKGAFAEQTHILADGSTMRDLASHIFRRKIEGGPIEPVISGGMDNPVEIAFTPTGELFFTSTFLQYPADGKRDGMGHAVYGSVFGKAHRVADEVTRTGPLMPIMTHLGPAAPSGLITLNPNARLIADEVWLAQDEKSDGTSEGTLVAAQFNLHQVSAHRLQRQGSTFTTQDTVLLRSDRVDFHPTDVLQDADGSLLVVDTGGWYDLCCPTSRVDQKIAGGGIYRLSGSKTSQPKMLPAVQWNDLQNAELLELVLDSRPWVAREALLQAKKSKQLSNTLLPLLKQRLAKAQVLHATREQLRLLQVAAFIGSNESLDIFLDVVHEMNGSAASQKQDELRTQLFAVHVLALNRVPLGDASIDFLHQLLQHPSPALRRRIAEWLGRIPQDSSSPHNSTQALLDCFTQSEIDPVLRHSLLYALIEIGDQTQLRKELLKPHHSEATAAALLAYNQLDLHPESDPRAYQFLFSENSEVQQIAADIVAKHPQWAESLADAESANHEASASMIRRLIAGDSTPSIRYQVLSAWRDSPQVQQAIALAIEQSTSPELSRELLKTWRGRTLPVVLDAALDSAITEVFSNDLQPLIGILASIKLPQVESGGMQARVRQYLESYSGEDSELAALQVASLLGCLPSAVKVDNASLTDQLLEQQDYRWLTGLQLTEADGAKLLAQADTLSMQNVGPWCAAISSIGSDALEKSMLQQLSKLPSAKTLDSNFLRNLYSKRSPSLRQLAQQVTQQLQQVDPNIQQSVTQQLQSLPAGDALRGMQVFRSSKTGCSSCHRVGYHGGSIGPELTRIGGTRTEEALLEAVLFPNARIEQSYRATQVLTDDDQVLNGIATDLGSSLRLQLTAERSILLPKSSILQMKPSPTSIMPSGISDQLTPQQLADLLTFLKASR